MRYLEERSPRGARRWVETLLQRVDLLGSQPESGATVELAGEPTPYRRIVNGDYLLFYRVDPDERVVYIVRLWHAARNPEDLVLD